MTKSTNQHISKAHDYFFRTAMMDKRVAREFFDMHLPEDLRKITDLNQLELQSGSYIDDLQQESIADMLFKTVIEKHETYLYLIVDHQSQPDKLMPFRTLRYTCNIINQHLKNTGASCIPLIVPLVVYHGKRPWTYSTDIKDLIDAPRHLIKNNFLQTFTLVDLNLIEDEVLKQNTWSGIMDLALKHIFESNIAPYFFDIIKLFDKLNYLDSKSFFDIVVRYMLDRGQMGDADKKAFINRVKDEVSSEIGEDIMGTLGEYLKAEAIKEALEKGLEQGSLKTAKHLLEKGMELSFIADVTELPLAKIKEIQLDLA